MSKKISKRPEFGKFYFGIEKDSKNERGDYTKKAYSFFDNDKVSYVLYLKDKKAIAGINAERLALSTYDALVFKEFKNFYYEIDDNHFIFVKTEDQSSPESHVFTFEIIPKDEIGESENEFADNYFEGYPYEKVSATLKDLRAYKKSNILLIGLFLLLLALALAFVYFNFFDKQNIQKVKPPKPYVAPMTMSEKNAIKNKMSIDFIEDTLNKVDKITTKGDLLTNINTTRFSMLELREYTEIAQEEPYYDEESNQWLYSNEEAKKGGFEVQGLTTIQKVIADVHYEANEVGNDDIVYQTDDGYNNIVYANNFSYDTKLLTKKCLVDIMELNATKVLRRDTDTIDFETKDVVPVIFLKEMRKLVKVCPIYLKRNYIVNNKLNVEFRLYRDRKGN